MARNVNDEGMMHEQQQMPEQAMTPKSKGGRPRRYAAPRCVLFLKVPEELHRECGTEAARLGLSMNEMVTGFIAAALRQRGLSIEA